jgi:ribosomal-protein-alanine N-acetyltransferase
MTLPVLSTPRLQLRPFVPAEAPVVQELAGRPEVALTTATIPHPYHDGIAEAWIESHAVGWAERRSLTLAVTTLEAGVVGAVTLRIEAPDHRGELGYWIGLPFWNRGYATEAAGAVLAYGFTELGLHRIQARHLTRNPASGRVMTKLGMRPEGVQRHYFVVRGKPEDVALYASLSTDREPWRVAP